MEIKKVGVVGCGIMGSGIVQVCAQAGYPVTVSEVNDELLQKGLASISSRLNRDAEKGRITEQDRDNIISRIKGTTDLKEFADCDLMIEAVLENMDEKLRIFSELDKICLGHTILSTNTSSMSIMDMAMATNRVDKVLGMHFFNPVPVMQLLEIVRTLATSDETFEVCRDFGDAIGKTTVVAKDTPGFIINRLLISYLLNAIRMLENGIATKEDIDKSIRLGLNHPMGPLTLSDLAGIDTLYYIASDMYEKLKDPQYAPPVLLQKMVAAGWYGRKSGKGFYEYDQK